MKADVKNEVHTQQVNNHLSNWCCIENKPCAYMRAVLKSSWIHLITPSRNFVEVRWLTTVRGMKITPLSYPHHYNLA